MACSAACHRKAKKQRRASLATLQPQTDTDMANSKVAALTESKDFPLPAPTRLLHKRAMPEGSKTGLHVDESQPSETDIHVDLHVEDSQPEKQISQSSKTPSERPKAYIKLSFGDDNLSNIGSDQVDTSPSSVQDTMLCAHGLQSETGILNIGDTTESDRHSKMKVSSRKRKVSSQKTTSLCASSKRKLEAYKARPLEPKEGELANDNNKMFETILQRKL